MNVKVRETIFVQSAVLLKIVFPEAELCLSKNIHVLVCVCMCVCLCGISAVALIELSYCGSNPDFCTMHCYSFVQDAPLGDKYGRKVSDCD